MPDENLLEIASYGVPPLISAGKLLWPFVCDEKKSLISVLQNQVVQISKATERWENRESQKQTLVNIAEANP